MSERKSLADLAVELGNAAQQYQGKRVLHVKSGDFYRITGVYFRESDMAVSVRYTPAGSEFHGQVEFGRSIEEMDFGKRFILE